MKRSGLLWRVLFFVVPFVIVLAAIGVIVSVSGKSVEPNKDELFELSIIHINDFHARFVQTSVSSAACVEGTEDTCVGGIARVYTVVRELVSTRPNAVFLNAGDNFQGTIWYTKFKWNVTAHFMNMLPHDALVIVILFYFILFYFICNIHLYPVACLSYNVVRINLFLLRYLFFTVVPFNSCVFFPVGLSSLTRHSKQVLLTCLTC